jgi:hypothetical protein
MAMKVVSGWTSTAFLSGTFFYEYSSQSVELLTRYTLAAPTTDVGDFALGTGTCSNGTFVNTGGSAAGAGEVFITERGAAAIHSVAASTTTDSIWMALPIPATAITLTNLAGNYSGMVYEPGAGASDDKNWAIGTVLSATSSVLSGPAYELTSTTSGTQATTGFQITLDTAGVSLGFLKGQIDLSGPTGGGIGASLRTLVCAVQENVGTGLKDVLVCGSDDLSGDFFGFILVKR